MATAMAYLNGEFMPLADAKIGVMTHAFNYGTAVFEGIRGNWNDEAGQLYLFRVRDHVERLRLSAKIMRMGLALSDDEIAIGDLLLRMARYGEGGEAPYPLAEACQDHYLSLKCEEALESGAEVRTETQPWAGG